MFEDMKEVTEKHLGIAKKIKKKKGKCIYVYCSECPFDDSNDKFGMGCLERGYAVNTRNSKKDKHLVETCEKFIKFAKEKLGV